jgi:tetratricopeptide (TPR) repeat protein
MSAGMEPRFPLRIPALGVALAATLLVWGPRAPAAVEPGRDAGARGVVVLEPEAPQELAPLGPGVASWLSFQLSSAGLEVTEPVSPPRAASGPPRALWSGIARASGGAHLVVPKLAVAGGRVEVQLVFVEGSSTEIVAAGRASASLEKLGEALRDATARLLAELEVPGSPGDGAAPRLADLAAYSRAATALRAGELARAYESLEGDRSSFAEALRAHVVQASRGRDVSVAEFARLAVAQGELDRAWVQLRGALKKGDDPALLVAAAGAAQLRGDPAQAIAAYEKASALDPQNGEPHLRRAELLLEEGDVEGARVAFEAAARLLPDEPRPLEALGELPNTPPERRAELLVRAGALRGARFEVDRAHAHLEQAIALDPPRSGRAWRELGAAQALAGRQHAASQSYERALSMGEEDPLTWTSFGRIRRGLEDALGSKKAFERALALDPNHAPAHRELGELYTGTGRPQEAIPHLEQAVRLRPDDAAARRAYARALSAAGDPERALGLLATPSPGGDEAVADLREAARIHGSRGDHEAARLALERAVELAPGSADLREQLARVHDARGDANAAANARDAVALLSGGVEPGGDEAQAAAAGSRTFEGLVASFPALRGEGRVVFLGLERDLGLRERVRELVRPSTLDPRRVALDLAVALGTRFELDPQPPAAPALERDLAALRAFDADTERIALVNDVLGAEALFVGRIALARPAEDGGALLHVELRMLSGRHAGEVAAYANTATLVFDAERFTSRNWAAFGIYGFAALVLALPVCRGWGSLLVRLDYASSGRGFFSIRIARRPGKAKKGNAKRGGRKHRFQQRLRSLGRFARTMAGRETVFRWLPARTYYVMVHGLLEDPQTNEVIGNYFEEKKVRIERGERVVLPFDFRPKEAPVQVQVWAGEQPAAQAIVAVRGMPPRYAREGKLVLALGRGTHVVRAGFDGFACEKRVELRELDGTTLHFSAHDAASLVFESCPEAVEPFLSFDDLAAADLLERAGQKRVADRVRGQYHRDRGEREKAAAFFEAAGRLEQAAELVAPAAAQRSATLFEKAGDFNRAAERYRAAGDLRRAAQAFEASYDLESAIECWREAGDAAKVLELLERLGSSFEAGELAAERGEVDRAIRNLQQVDLRSPHYGKACERLAEILVGQQEFELAAQKLHDAVYASGGDDAPVELIARLAEAFDRAGAAKEALEAWEVVRRRDLNFPGVATRIQELREALRKPAPGEAAPEAATVSTPPAESRYEILGELGRGGMGVVLQARDKRLGRVVALKRLPDNLRDHPTAVKLFLREAQAIAALNHPNIVTLYDADQDEHGFFLTMEHLEGTPLHQLLRKHRRLVPKDAARIGVQVASGLQYAHERRVVHRDVKTANLFLTRERVVKIMDFGLAKVIEEVRRSSTVIGGTPFYMAPEQAAGEPVDHRADLYAFGVTLFELVSGSVPFRDGDIAYHHRHTPAPDLRGKAPGVPDSLAELVAALLAKRPDDRPATTAEVGRRLQEIATKA